MLAFLVFSLGATAQTEKGTILIGGGIGFSKTSSDYESELFNHESSSFNFNFNPDFALFFKDTWAVGISMPLSWSKNEILSDQGNNDVIYENKLTDIGIAPFIRKYFPFGEKFSAFGQLQAGYYYLSSSNNLEDPDNNFKSNRIGVEGTLGLAYFPKNWLGINLSIIPISYNYSDVDNEVNPAEFSYKSNGINFGLNTSSINLGVNFFLSKK